VIWLAGGGHGDVGRAARASRVMAFDDQDTGTCWVCCCCFTGLCSRSCRGEGPRCCSIWFMSYRPKREEEVVEEGLVGRAQKAGIEGVLCDTFGWCAIRCKASLKVKGR